MGFTTRFATQSVLNSIMAAPSNSTMKHQHVSGVTSLSPSPPPDYVVLYIPMYGASVSCSLVLQSGKLKQRSRYSRYSSTGAAPCVYFAVRMCAVLSVPVCEYCSASSYREVQFLRDGERTAYSPVHPTNCTY